MVTALPWCPGALLPHEGIGHNPCGFACCFDGCTIPTLQNHSGFDRPRGLLHIGSATRTGQLPDKTRRAIWHLDVGSVFSHCRTKPRPTGNRPTHCPVNEHCSDIAASSRVGGASRRAGRWGGGEG
jgi:hypothetical protein